MDQVTETVRFVAVIKSREDDQRRFFGRAYVTKDEDGAQVVDASGDVIDDDASMSALEESFYEFVKSYRSGDLEHQQFGAATLVEGVVVTDAKKRAGLFPDSMPSGVYVGFEAEDSPAGDELWEGVKSGRLASLSIVGEGERVPL